MRPFQHLLPTRGLSWCCSGRLPWLRAVFRRSGGATRGRWEPDREAGPRQDDAHQRVRGPQQDVVPFRGRRDHDNPQEGEDEREASGEQRYERPAGIAEGEVVDPLVPCLECRNQVAVQPANRDGHNHDGEGEEEEVQHDAHEQLPDCGNRSAEPVGQVASVISQVALLGLPTAKALLGVSVTVFTTRSFVWAPFRLESFSGGTSCSP